MWKRLFGARNPAPAAITIVSGLPRSGTSMMMKMLAAGGMEVMTDNVRQADADNPHGYYELENVKHLQDDAAFLDEAHGKAVKLISMFLPDLPPHKHYRIIFMQRDMEEVLASQKVMLKRRGKHTSRDDQEMGSRFANHLADIAAWLKTQAHIEVLYVNYADVMNYPLASAEQVNRFLGNGLDPQKMATAVDQTLYRNKAPRE
jgi:hypothetical protein